MPNFHEAPAVEEFALTLIPTYHPELATARIRYVFVEKASMKNGRPVLGKSRKFTGALEFLLEADFMIEVALDQWNELSAQQRQALVDHLLECCTGEEDEEDPGAPMKWGTRGPDVSEFMSILQRHGAWNEALSGFVSVSQRLNVAALVSEVTSVGTAATIAENN